jgi:hypothetical protein
MDLSVIDRRRVIYRERCVRELCFFPSLEIWSTTGSKLHMQTPISVWPIRTVTAKRTSMPINRLSGPPPPGILQSSPDPALRIVGPGFLQCSARRHITRQRLGLDPSDDATATADASSQLQTLSQRSLAADPQRFRRNSRPCTQRRRADLTSMLLRRRSLAPGGPSPCSRVERIRPYERASYVGAQATRAGIGRRLHGNLPYPIPWLSPLKSCNSVDERRSLAARRPMNALWAPELGKSSCVSTWQPLRERLGRSVSMRDGDSFASPMKHAFAM